jgi:hypothetical protein
VTGVHLCDWVQKNKKKGDKTLLCPPPSRQLAWCCDLAVAVPAGDGPSQVAGVYAAGDFLSWFQKFVKAVKRSRLNDVRFMLDSDLERVGGGWHVCNICVPLYFS